MKTIEDSAYEHVRGRALHSSISNIDSFKSGVAFAQRWIPIMNELPSRERVLIKFITPSGHECITVGNYEPDYAMWFVDSGKLGKISAWRPIEYK